MTPTPWLATEHDELPARRQSWRQRWLTGALCLAAACTDGEKLVTIRSHSADGGRDAWCSGDAPVSLEECSNTGDCPAATTCVTRSQDLDAAVRPARVCAAINARSKRTGALKVGFGVRDMKIDEKVSPSGESSTFLFSPPASATRVVCALFVCPPEVEITASFEVAGRPGNEYAIANYDQCCSRQQNFDLRGESGDLIFDPIATAETCAPLDDAGRTCLRGGVSDLLVGCWAFDGARISAATNIVSVDPDHLTALVAAQLGESIADSCEVDGGPLRDGTTCGDDTRFGTCWQGDCAERCVTDLDCRAPMTCTFDGLSGTLGACVAPALDGGVLDGGSP